MSSTHLITAEAFDSGDVAQTTMMVAIGSLSIAGKALPGVDHLIARYNAHAELYLECSTEGRPFAKAIGENAVISGGELSEAVALIPIQEDVSRIVFVPRRQPFLLDWGRDARVASAVIVNAPNLQYCAEPLSFIRDAFQLTLRETTGAREAFQQLSLHKNDAVATGILDIARTDGAPLSHAAALEEAHRLNTFLTFVRGGACALGHIDARDVQGERAFASLGFGAHDGLYAERGWSADMVIRRAPDMYQLYCAASADKSVGTVLRRAIDYYRAANVARASSKEVALVASYAGLEALVPHILVSQAGWANSALRAPFAEKLRATTQFVGVKADLFEHAPELRQRVSAAADAYDVLALFRNRVTHYRENFSSSGLELHEAWQASQWMCEILIMHVVGYRGQMNDRRRYTGWRGPSVEVPLP